VASSARWWKVAKNEVAAAPGVNDRNMRIGQVESQGLKYFLKKSLFPSGLAPRMIRSGLLAGLTMDLDFAHHTQRWLGLQERELYGWFRRLSRGIETAVDVGASEGMYTLYFLAKTPAKKVFAFEPSEDGLRQLKSNLALNALSDSARLEIIPKCVGPSVNSQEVSLDSLAAHLDQPCLIKVDIDGGEAALLDGARTLLQSPETRWIIEVHSKALQEQCLEILQAANYSALVVRNAWWRNFLPELRPGELNHWIIALHRDNRLRLRG
jgi:hypothetical protein